MKHCFAPLLLFISLLAVAQEDGYRTIFTRDHWPVTGVNASQMEHGMEDGVNIYKAPVDKRENQYLREYTVYGFNVRKNWKISYKMDLGKYGYGVRFRMSRNADMDGLFFIAHAKPYMEGFDCPCIELQYATASGNTTEVVELADKWDLDILNDVGFEHYSNALYIYLNGEAVASMVLQDNRPVFPEINSPTVDFVFPSVSGYTRLGGFKIEAE